MNIGPMGNGKIDEADVAILTGIGAWWKVNGECIRGTARTPLAVQAWGESTLRRGSRLRGDATAGHAGQARKANRLYLHVFDWPAPSSVEGPATSRLVVGGLLTDMTKAYLLSNPGTPLETKRAGKGIVITVPSAAPDRADSVVVVECAGEPKTDSVRLVSSAVPVETLRGFDGVVTGKLHFGPGKKTDDVVMDWTKKDYAVAWPVRLNEKATFRLRHLTLKP